MTATSKLSSLVGAIIALMGVAAPLSAQTYVISAYTDVGVDWSNAYFYVSVVDESDMSCCPGAYHYDYNGGASVSGPSGTYSASGSGNYFVVEVPINPDVEEEGWWVEAGLSFMCSWGGYLSGDADPIPAATFTFRHHYDFSYSDGADKHYVRMNDSAGRKCAVPEVIWDTFAWTMTSSGVGGNIGPIGGCVRTCSAGSNLPVSGPTGTFGTSGVGVC